MKKQNFPIRQKLQFRFFIIMLIYTLSGLIAMPLLEYIFSRFENQVFSWLYLRLDVIYFFYLVAGLACIFYHYWKKPWDYLDEVVTAAQIVYEQNSQAVELSEPLREVEQ